MNEQQMYHALRCAYNAGADRIPWQYVLDVLRKGLGMEHLRTMSPPVALTCRIQYPQLTELEQYIENARG